MILPLVVVVLVILVLVGRMSWRDGVIAFLVVLALLWLLNATGVL